MLKVPSTQNCNFFKQDQVVFLYAHTDKHQTLLQVDTINLGEHGQACPNYAK